MQIIEELLQRLAAVLLSAVWFAIPLGFGIYQHSFAPELPQLVVDDSRLAAGEQRVVWLSEDPVAVGVDEGSDEPVQAEEAPEEAAPADAGSGSPTPAPTRSSAPTQVAAAGQGGNGPVSTVMRRPGYEGIEIGELSTGAKVRPSGRADCEDPNPAVTQVGDDVYRVERGLVDHYAGDWDALGRLGRIRVHENERGRRDGFELRGIRCGSLLAQVGLKNRDTVHSVNGKNVKNLFGALSAYRRFRRDERVEVEITRNGETVFITYLMVG